MNFDAKQLEVLCEEVIKCARKAANFIREERTVFRYEKAEQKGLNDLVSYVDRVAEDMLIQALKPLLPEAGFLVEENTLFVKNEYNWIIDPLDGTTNFVHGIPCYAVSIALERKGEVLLGVVHEVSRDECFSAVTGMGAFLNARPIGVSARGKLSESLIATGFPIYNFDRLNAYLNTLQHLMRHTQGIRRIGSAATDLCYLACGRVDAFFEYNLNPWDVAAGACIVKEAGGLIEDFSAGQDWLYGKEICAGNPYLFSEFKSVIGQFMGAKF
ncbi:MAG TPA: inositol monophosphatase family protein [Bacteroidia bacterium]|nr:inositol monophosphatase family protein [Bacteroidia bacterium]